jgi:hypothetical protein
LKCLWQREDIKYWSCIHVLTLVWRGQPIFG